MAATFMRLAAASFRVKAGDPAHNAQLALRRIMQAYEEGAQLILLGELCLTGSCCGDLYEHQALLSESISALHSVIKLTADLPIVWFIGLPVRLGSEVVSCMAAAQSGRLLALIPKREAAGGLPEPLTGVPIGDVAMRCNDLSARLRFGVEKPAGAALMLHASSLAASDRSMQALHRIFGAARGAVVYASNAGDSNTDYVFDGACAIYENGEILACADGYDGALVLADVDTKILGGGYPPDDTQMQIDLPPLASVWRRLSQTPWGADASQCERVLDLQARALAQRLDHIGANGFAVGVSGGLDSALALLACARAADLLGRDRRDVLAVMMPGYGSGSRTAANAKKLADALGVKEERISILPLCDRLLGDIGHDGSPDTTFENAQARTRALLLMSIANRRGLLNVGTGDLSESALGFTTFGGDHLSFFNINASLLKTQVRAVLRHAADRDARLDVLYDILDTPVSPELLPLTDGETTQYTEELVGPYDLMDFYIYYLLRYAMSCGMLYERARLAFEYEPAFLKERLEVLIRRFFANQFKRNCMPEGPMLGALSLSPRSFRLPSDASPAAWLQELKEL